MNPSSFQLIVVREIDPELRPDPDGLLHPLPATDAKSSIQLEQRDGSSTKRLVSSGFKLMDVSSGAAKQLAAVKDVRLDVIITDARVAFACSKFAKGGGWTPFGLAAVPVAIVANSVSKTKAAMRRRGKMLVGHVRYPWLSDVGGSPKMGFGDSEQIRFCITSENGRLLALDVTVPKNIDSTAVAAEIAQRAARYRLSTDDPRIGEHRASLEILAQATPLSGTKGKFGLHSFPEPWPVGDEGARLSPVRTLAQ